ncbi:protein folded gastrulation [Drosophila albomicans]|uniref:Protein folded gastrulation n=1 Tax=Drosophila albomicans TaxID=7291 RepID=A0A6P8WZ89_DROAB|nr:protein folded gastrulation [Drosophila albomicans]XP_051859004.1 protein folded gastrulation [Drosophila albomicans]
MATRSTTASGMLLALALTLTLTLTALQMQLASVEALPITSRPIEGNAQLLAWEEWQRLTPDQRTLEKEKKVTAKSIFTLPFRHCPPDHKRYGDRCIPQINIDPTDLIKQELLIELSPGGSAPSVNLDYDYSDSDGDEDSDELFINVPLMQKGQLLPPLQPNGAAEDQALPSEDAPLKFNIFENKYPMTLDTAAKSTATTATTTTTVTTTETTTAATATATATTTAATVQQSSNRIATQLDDLMADSSVALPSTTTLSISLPPSSSNIDDFGSIEAIVVPAGLPVNEKASIQLVTKADAPSTATATATSTTTAMLNADADEQQQQQQQHNEKELQMNEERVQPSEDDGEEALAQLLKVDTLLPATAYGSSVDLLPPFSHRRVAPLLSADLDDADESAATDMAPTADATPTTATATATAAATTSATTAKGELDAQGENRVMLKKSKVQPVQLSSTVATTTPTTTPTTATATTIAESSSATTTTTTTTAAAEVEATATATTTSDTAAVTTTTTVAAAAAAAADEGDVAAIHQDANGNAKDDDRFYYQHSDSTTSSTTATATSSSSSGNTVADAVDLDELNYMAASDNLMTNTIGGQGDSEKAAGEMNFEQELSIINELVKGKWRLSQLRQQQQHQQQQLLNSSSSSTTTAATTTSVESSEVTSSTPAASENTTFWSKLMPMLSQSQSSTEATTAATTDETAETITATATATTTAQSSVADTSIATATTAATTTAATTTTTTAAAATTSHLSINTNRSNRNSKIIRIDSIVESSTTTTTTTTTTPAPTATPATPTVSSNSSNAAAYTPFWWLPNFGVRLDRQVDENGEDRSLLLRFFRPFRAGNTAEDATRITTLPSRR